MLLDIQRGFEQIAIGINSMVTLGKAGSRMHAKWGSLLDAPPDNMPQKMPPDAMDPKGTGHFNIFTAIKNLDGSTLGSTDLAGAAPDAAEEMNKLFGELSSSAGPRVSKRLLRKIGGLGSKILDEYNEFGPDDDGASLEAFYDVFQDALESEAKMAWTPEFWWETHGDEIAGINEGRMENKMRITKRQLRKIIREEKQRINEMWGTGGEQMSVLIQFAQAYASLGGAVQAQVNEIINAYVDGGEDIFAEAVYEVNPNAIDLAYSRLAPILRAYSGDLGDEGDMVLDALNAAKEIFAQGDAEVEADARAAGDL